MSGEWRLGITNDPMWLNDLRLMGSIPFSECDDCGVLVGHPEKHREWHESIAIDALREAPSD